MEALHISMRTRLIRAAISAGLLGGSLAMLVVLARSRPLPGLNDNQVEAQTIAVFRAKKMQVPRQWVGYGTVKSIDSADVPARVGATVVEIAADINVGSAIAKGQFLVQLDDQDFRRMMDSADQQLAVIDAQLGSLMVEESGLAERLKLAKEDGQLVRSDEARVREAVASQAAVQRELDRARQLGIVADRTELLLREAINQITPRRAALHAQDEIQKSMRDTARKNVERCRITSPIAGSLQRFDLEVGENVLSGQVVARVVDVSKVEIPIRLAASARGSVRVGDPVTIDVVGQTIRSMRSSIVRIEPEDDSVERTMTVYAEMEQAADLESRLAPGAFVEAFVESADATMRTVLPRRAVRADRVLELVDGTLRGRPVVVSHAFVGLIADSGLDDREWIVLQNTLEDGTILSVDGGRTVSTGTRVRAAEPTPTASASTPPARTEGGAAR